MDKAKKAQWVAALRSGEYRQTKGALCRSAHEGKRSYCCLGVASDLAVKAGVGAWQDVIDFDYVRYSDDGTLQNSVQGYYSEQVMAWLGMPGGLGYVRDEASPIKFDYINPDTDLPDLVFIDLANLNDDGFTFDQIADVIDYFL